MFADIDSDLADPSVVAQLSNDTSREIYLANLCHKVDVVEAMLLALVPSLSGDTASVFEIEIKRPGVGSFRMLVNGHMMIYNIMLLSAQMTFSRVENVQLLYHGRRLRPQMTVADYALTETDVLYFSHIGGE